MVEEFHIGFQDEASPPSRDVLCSFQNCGSGQCLGTATCLESVI